MTKGTDLTAHKRFSHGGGSYIYQGHNIEKIDGRWVFAIDGRRMKTFTLREAKLVIENKETYSKAIQLEKAGA